MRIAIVGNFGLSGKQTMAVRALPMAQALAGRGHTLAMAMPLREAGEKPGRVEPKAVDVFYAGRGPGLPGLAHLWQLLVLAFLCLRWHPEVLYCFKPIAYSGALLHLFWLLRRLGLYRGLLLLDTDDWEGEGGWNEKQPWPRWLKALVARQELWSLRHADAVTVASKSLQKMVQEIGGARTLYLPNAPAVSSPGLAGPADEGLREALGLADRPVVLLYTRFVEFDLGRLLQLFEGVVRRRPDAALLVVGQGFHGEEMRLAKMAADRGLDQQLVLAGWVQVERLPDYLHAADVAVYPLDDTLLNRTKCPVKLLDLVVAGVPVVADRVGQAEEYLDDGRTGVLVPPGDVRAMAEAVVALLGDPDRRRALGEAARREAPARWNWDLWAAEVDRLLVALRSGVGMA